MPRDNEGGLTLIETMMAITILALLVLGITPLIASSIRGASLSRNYTVAKNLGQEAMERIRGLPYFDNAQKRDVLDLYFPNLVATGTTGYQSGPKSFVTRCTPTSALPVASGALACIPDQADGSSRIPAGYSVAFRAEFVTPAVQASGRETFAVKTPSAGYDSANTATNTPPSQLLRMTIDVGWTEGANQRTYTLTSIVGERRLSELKVRGSGSVDFVVQALTSYQDSGGRLSNLRATVGRAVSEVDIRAFASADQEVNAAEIVLAREEFTDATGAVQPGETLATISGANPSLHAPPNLLPAPVATAGAQSLVHTELTPNKTIAEISATSANNALPAPASTPGVQVTSELPVSAGNFTFSGGSGTPHFWVDNQADVSNAAVRQLDPARHVMTLFRQGGAYIAGRSSATTTPITDPNTRRVETRATGSFARLELLPSIPVGTASNRGVVIIENFAANLTCKATNSSTGTNAAAATGSWSATLKYWQDSNPGDGITAGSYQTLPLDGSLSGGTSGGVDQLAARSRESNVVVIDSFLLNSSLTPQVWLFDDPARGRIGFLDEWSSQPIISSSVTATDVRVNLSSAINIVTARTDEKNLESKLTVSIGKQSCQAVDARG